MAFNIEIHVTDQMINQFIELSGLQVHSVEHFSRLKKTRRFRQALVRAVAQVFNTAGEHALVNRELLDGFGPIATDDTDHRRFALRYRPGTVDTET